MSNKIIRGTIMVITLSGEIRSVTAWTQQTPQRENYVLIIPRGIVINDLIYKPVLIAIFNIINTVFTVTANSPLTGDFHITNYVI